MTYIYNSYVFGTKDVRKVFKLRPDVLVHFVCNLCKGNCFLSLSSVLKRVTLFFYRLYLLQNADLGGQAMGPQRPIHCLGSVQFTFGLSLWCSHTINCGLCQPHIVFVYLSTSFKGCLSPVKIIQIIRPVGVIST